MSNFIVVACVVCAAIFPIGAAFAEDVGVRDERSSSVPEKAVDALTRDVAASSTAPQNVPPQSLAETARLPKSFNLDIKMDGNGIRLGGQLLGDKGVSAAWLGANVQGDNYGVTGGFQGHGGPPRDFKLNMELLPGWARTATRLWLMLH